MTGERHDIPEYFARFIAHYFGDHGRDWLARLPALIERYARRWELEVHPPFEGLSFNYVTPVTRAGGSSAVLKIGVPEPEARCEILALGHFDGRGMARRIAFALDDYAMLIERLTPGTMLSSLLPGREDEATMMAVEVMRAIATPAPEGAHEFPSIADWARRGMRNLRAAFDGGTGPFPRPLVERAESLFDELLDSTNDVALLHGDFHHMNILASDEYGWLAIDPKGVIGDLAYEPGAFLRNPLPDLLEQPNTRQILARRIDHFSEALALDRRRVHGWALAGAVLSAWWSYDDIGSWRPAIALAEQLAAINDR